MTTHTRVRPTRAQNINALYLTAPAGVDREMVERIYWHQLENEQDEMLDAENARIEAEFETEDRTDAEMTRTWHTPVVEETDEPIPAAITDVNLLSAGKAIFTVSNPNGERYTFRITRKDSRNGGFVYFAGLLSGPSNDADYSYVGLYLPDTGEVRRTSKSRVGEDSKALAVLRWAIKVLGGKTQLPAGYHIDHAGYCMACGRLLTVPESIHRGLGPVCAGVA